MADEILKFSQFQSFVDGSFWHVLAKQKLNTYKLNEGPFSVFGEIEHVFKTSGGTNRLLISMNSFEKRSERHPNIYQIKGKVWMLNTIESFRNKDKTELLNAFGEKRIIASIRSYDFLKRPDSICQFTLLTYADLKKFTFYFWFAFPAPVFPVNPVVKSDVKYLDEVTSDIEMTTFLKLFDELQSISHSMFFSVFVNGGNVKLDTFASFNVNDNDCILGFCDSSSNPNYPSWPLRNILFAICATMIPCNEKRLVKIISFRISYSDNVRQWKFSSVLSVELTGFDLNKMDNIQFVGWEKWQNELKPRFVNLSSSMNPQKLVENAVDLNLKLMKWRLIPDLNLDVIANAKCLLLGAGTLGCNVARQLLAWNVGHITLVDNGQVSYSNPVRQSLFTYEQSINGGLKKAEAAAQSLQKIYPLLNVQSYDITIPMPGHSVSPSQIPITREACNLLSQLIASHDVIFLLLDTREGRWLPTVLSYVHSKMVINAALGFDTYLVMRHGISPAPGVSPSFAQQNIKDNSNGCSMKNQGHIKGDELGCYFCTDVVGPKDSLKDRTLDQQCTVTRPGVSMVAAALAVELMVTLFQHEDGPRAAANCITDNFDFISCLGSTPHQIRGYLSCFNNILPLYRASEYCTACSQKVLDAYAAGGFNDFLLKVFNEHDYLERVAGLSDLQSSVDMECVTALSDSCSDD